MGWWPFNGNANDESGNENNGTANAVSIIADRFGNANSAFAFDGNLSNVSGDASRLPSGQKSVSFWFKGELPVDQSWFFGYGGGNCGTSFLIYSNSSQCIGNLGDNINFSQHCCVNSFKNEIVLNKTICYKSQYQ